MFNRLSIAICFAATVCCFASADDPETAARYTELATKMAAEYSIDAAGRALELVEEPVLTWTNPEVGEIYGVVFVWTDQGRPAVIASFFQWYSPYQHGTHEFQSLSTDPIVGVRKNQLDWRTSKPGLQWKPVPNDPLVGEASSQRLTRMRLIARQFTVTMTDKDGSEEKLRLLSQPLLRYQSPVNGVADGAVFAFARATDPETLLLLEVREERGKPALYYALARSNFLPFSATYDGREIWKVDRLERSVMKRGTEPYTKYIFE